MRRSSSFPFLPSCASLLHPFRVDAILVIFGFAFAPHSRLLKAFDIRMNKADQLKLSPPRLFPTLGGYFRDKLFFCHSILTFPSVDQIVMSQFQPLTCIVVSTRGDLTLLQRQTSCGVSISVALRLLPGSARVGHWRQLGFTSHHCRSVRGRFFCFISSQEKLASLSFSRGALSSSSTFAGNTQRTTCSHQLRPIGRRKLLGTRMR